MDGLLNRNPTRGSSTLLAHDAETIEHKRAPGWSRTDASYTVSLLMLIAILWVATRPYHGVVGDARLYMVQALRELHPTRFANDLYFQFGSQDRFTVFSRLYAPLVSMLGVGNTGITLVVIGQSLWVGGLLYLALSLIRPRSYALLSAAITIALPSAYAVWLTGYGEPFVTPRLFAEALTMLALGLLLRRHTLWALGILVLSATIHPLMTLPGVALAFLYLALGQPLWWMVIAGGFIAVAGLSIGGVQPFANLRLTFDPQWLAIAKVRDGMCFITRWHADAYLRVLGTIALAILALMSAEPRDRRFFGSVLVIGIGGIVCTSLGADLAHNVFISEIQSYRSMWLLTLITNLLLIPLFSELIYRGDAVDFTRFMFIVTLFCLFISRFIPAIIFIAAPMATITSLAGIWQFMTNRQLPFYIRYFCLLLVSLCCAATILFVYGYKVSLEPLPEEFRRSLYSSALVIAALGIMVFQVMAVGPQRPGRLLPWLTVALFAAALLGWNARTPWTQFVESSRPVPESLAAFLPQNASVYWEGGVRMLWLRLERPSYFSCAQGTGSVFFRGTAIAYQHRAESFWPLRTIDFHKSIYCLNLDKERKPSRTRAELKEVCRREPALDYLVLLRPVENVAAMIWDSPVSFQYERIVNGKLIVYQTKRFFIYSCSGMR